MIYKNPVILSDYSDPDVIRVKDNYYLIASSFNHTPGIPILKSKNLVDYKIIGYVYDNLPMDKFNKVCHGEGAWAPSIRYHNGIYYIAIPFPDEGIYISYTTDIEGKWSTPYCLIEGKGLEDPCPIWLGDKCYMVIGFAKSRAGFNSCLGLYEVSPDLKTKISDTYTIIFDGHNTQPTIEGPKFYTHGDYIYIMAPAGSVKTGWQTCLRSKNVYGPYEEKIVMCQNDSKINGPHQGALIDLPNGEYAFIHFQDMDAYGRVCHLQPVKWINDWPIVGNVKDELLNGTPYEEHEYLIDKKSNYKIDSSDLFKNKLSLMWQTPANKQKGWYEINYGLKLNCIYSGDIEYKALNLTPNLFLTKILFESFVVKTKAKLNLINDGDEVGLAFMGYDYAYISIRKIDGINYLCLSEGHFNQNDNIIYKEVFNDNEIIFNMKYIKPDTYYLGFNNKYLKTPFTAKKGRWIGGKYGIFAKGLKLGGNAVFEYFKVKDKGGIKK